jgi:hypothetical protein
MNRANGLSEIEGKAAMGSGERIGRRASFKYKQDSASLIRENLWQSVALKLSGEK